MPANAFISYADGDRDFADQLLRALNDEGHERAITFWSDHDLKLGENWDDLLRDALRRADVLIAIMTPAALDSAWVMSELGAAHAAKKPVIPVIPPRRSVDVRSFVPNSPPIKAGSRSIDAVAREVLDRVEDLVSNPAAA